MINVRKFSLIPALLLSFIGCSRQNEYISISGYAQGGTYIVKLNMCGAEGRVRVDPEDIKAGIDSVITAIDNSVSGYNEKSLLSRFNRGEKIVPDSIFLDIYNISYRFYEDTDGAFDVAAGPLFDIWGFGFRDGEFPSDEQVEKVRKSCGMDGLPGDIHMAVDDDGSIRPESLLAGGAAEGRSLPRLNYNAIAQGYTCDLIAHYLYSLGVKDMLVDIGGEIYCDGLNPAGKPWSIGVDKPVDGNNVPGAMLEGTLSTDGGPCGIVTSGNYRKYYIRNGRKYAHTIDPRTGYPVSDSLLSATVIAEDATTADALATYCMVIGFEKSRDFISSRPDLRGYLIYAKSPVRDEQGTEDQDRLSFGTWISE